MDEQLNVLSGLDENFNTTEDVFENKLIQNEACKYCNNNPKNGGNGVCQCILGVPKVT